MKKEKTRPEFRKFFEACGIPRLTREEMGFLETFKLTWNHKKNLKTISDLLIKLKTQKDFQMVENPTSSFLNSRKTSRSRSPTRIRALSCLSYDWEFLTDPMNSTETLRKIRQDAEIQLQQYWNRLTELFHNPEIQRDKYRVTPFLLDSLTPFNNRKEESHPFS